MSKNKQTLININSHMVDFLNECGIDKVAHDAVVLAWISSSNQSSLKKSIAKKTVEIATIKKPHTAYIIFCNQNRDRVRSENSGTLLATQVTSTLAQEWKSLTEDQKVQYKDAAIKQKENYVLLTQPVIVVPAQVAEVKAVAVAVEVAVVTVEKVKKTRAKKV